ncbi:MAG TPA: helix-hairpin-helix domain-containing protein, partial [Vulgatibacter sp.]
MENADVAGVLAEMASMTEVLGGNPFKVRAFRQAAQVVDTLPGPVSDLRQGGQLESLPGIGPRIAEKIGEILDTGTCEEHVELAAQVPIGVIELLRIEGLGPKTAQQLWKGLNVTDVRSLREAISSGRIRELPRMRPVRLQGLTAALRRYQVRG